MGDYDFTLSFSFLVEADQIFARFLNEMYVHHCPKEDKIRQKKEKKYLMRRKSRKSFVMK
jgi:hypothetical protein